MLENTKQAQEQTTMAKKEEGKTQFEEFHPDVDIEEAKDDYILNIDIPGLTTDAIDIKLDKDILTVEGNAIIEGLQPRHYYRQFRVMRGMDASQCRADYKHGVLTLRLAKPKTSSPQQIKIACE